MDSLCERRPEIEHRPALDGLRGVAILAVLLYHGGVSWAPGGYLGVEAFFVLSGYLITSLLLVEWQSYEKIRLARFWARRARRLLPALYVVVIVVSIRQALAGAGGAVPHFGLDGIATLFYFANWQQIASSSSYFAGSALVSPLEHTWSLAIEEQFYVIWPLVVLLGASLGRRLRPTSRSGRRHVCAAAEGGPRRSLPVLLVVSVAGICASTAEMAISFHDGSGLDRAYYGSDTRAHGLLTGAALAIAIALWKSRAPSSSAPRSRGPLRILAHLCGCLGAAGLVVAVLEATGTSPWLYEGGYLLLDLGVAAMVLSVVAFEASPLRAVLELWPLRFLGLISYGLYLWHFPLFLWLDASDTGVTGAGLFGLRIAASVTAAVLSYVLVEQPIRLRRLPERVVALLGPAGLSAAVAAVVVATSAAVVAAPLPSGRVQVASSPTASGPGTSLGCGESGFSAERTERVEAFRGCPVVRVLLVGDSVALTLGLQLAQGARLYGVRLDNGAVLGCGFLTGGLVESPGYLGPQAAACRSSVSTWRRDARRFRPQVVVVEMGWWDSFDRLWKGHDAHLGQRLFDGELLSRMVELAKVLGSRHVPVVFLTVPWMSPAPLPNGDPAPAASPDRHREVNALLADAAEALPGEAYLFDIDSYVAPHGRFQADVGGGVCRTPDGIHFYFGTSAADVLPTHCGQLTQAGLLPYLRRLVDARRSS